MAVGSLSGVITFVPDPSQTADKVPKPPITESLPLPPNTVTAIFGTPNGLPESENTIKVITRKTTPDTRPSISSHVRDGETYNTHKTSTRTDPVDHTSVVTRRDDVVDMAGETETRTCDTKPGATSSFTTFDFAATVVPDLQYPVNMGNGTSVRTCDSGPSITSIDEPFSSTHYTGEVFPSTIYTNDAVATVGVAIPDSVFLIITRIEAAAVATATVDAASPGSMWSIAAETRGAASPDGMWSAAAETGTVTETQIEMQRGMSTVAASTVFATPAVRADEVDAVEPQTRLGMMLENGAIVVLLGAVLFMGARRGSKKA